MTRGFAIIVFVLIFARYAPGTSTPQDVDARKPIVSDGASFLEPKSWTRIAPDKGKTKGWFIGADSDRSAPKTMIMIDIGRPTNDDLRATAEKMAKTWGGVVLDQGATLDGVEALRVRVEKPGPGLRPIEGVVAIKGGRIFLIMGGAIPGRVVVDEVEEVRKSWKWLK